MKRKGLSPLIAAVLLIAFVMAIGAMFSEWSQELVQDRTEATGEHQGELLDCSGNTIEFVEVEENLEDEEVEVMLQARGGQLGEIILTARPSNQQGETVLEGDNDLATAVIEDITEEQDQIEASSVPCDVRSTYDLN